VSVDCVGSYLTFPELFEAATGSAPYPYQRRLAEDGLPDVLDVETGMGKSAGVVMAWLWRRRFHPDPAVRSSTPHWLVLCEPMRTLTEQAERSVVEWIDTLGLHQNVYVHVVLGGRERPGDEWRRRPDADAVVIGTLDMLLSRVLNRGYGAGRFAWPIDFGLLNSGTQWVFDEVQLMGPALATSRQMQAFRGTLGTAAPTSSTWMSATVDLAALATVDNPTDRLKPMVLEEEDQLDANLRKRLDATRIIRQLHVDQTPKRRAAEMAAAVERLHRPGARTLVVLNTVATAQAVAAVLQRLSGPPTVLIHRRFRPPERQEAFRVAALEPIDPGGPGLVVVATQVVEAGVDITSDVLVTEAAPWPSMVQRAGRCNRYGEAAQAELWWVAVPRTQAAPYEAVDLEAAERALADLEGQPVTARSLRLRTVPVTRSPHPVLRKSDVLSLFDTTPDLSGNDIDIAPFIRDGDELDAFLVWRDLGKKRPEDRAASPNPEELCPVPLGKDLRDFVAANAVWRFDHVSGGWQLARAVDLRPGQVMLTDISAGGYTSVAGWLPASKVPVASRQVAEPGQTLIGGEEATGDDALTFVGEWIPLRQHLEDVGREVGRLLEVLDPPGIDTDMRRAAVETGRLHDLGKAHEVFQQTLERCASEADRAVVAAGAPWAKSRRAGPGVRHARPYFRHELVSALALLGEGEDALREVNEPDLVIYLVAAHHGRVRLGIRSLPDEAERGSVLGVCDGDVLPAVAVPGGGIPPLRLSLEPARLGRSAQGGRSWGERARALLDRQDLGPFRLAYLEAVVRLADWRASGQGAR
jgi:CRISPR-associated endonuclease/helicase Cas3